LRGLRVIIGFLNLSLSAKYFGAGLERDIWLLALSGLLILDLLVWGPLNETFRAKISFLKNDEGEKTALSAARSLLLVVGMISSFISVLIIVFPNFLAQLLAPGYPAEDLSKLIFMIQALAPMFVFGPINRILNGLLNTYGSFVTPEVSGVVSQLSTSLIIIGLTPVYGIVSLVISYYTGVISLLLFLVVQLRKAGVRLFGSWREVKLYDARMLLIPSLPFFLPYFVGQTGQVVEKALASTTVGAVSAIDYARKFSDISLEVLVSSIAGLLIPILSGYYVRGEKQLFKLEFTKMYQFGLLCLVLIVGMLVPCSGDFITILYGNSGLSFDQLHTISTLTACYAVSIVIIFIYQTFGAAMISANRSREYAYIGVLGQLIMISSNILLFRYFSIYIFPASLFISHGISAMLMWLRFPVKSNLIRVTTKYISLLVFAIACSFGFGYTFGHPNPFLNLFFHSLCTLAVIVIVGFLFKFDEYKALMKFIKRSS